MFGRRGSSNRTRDGGESLSVTDRALQIVGKTRKARDEIRGPQTVVTVIKNKGRKDEELIAKYACNILGEDWRDILINAGYATSGSNSLASAQYMALSANAATPLKTNAFPAEITANGLGRALGTASHTNKTNTFKITHTFEATGAVANVQKVALFNAASGGTKAHEVTFTAVTVANGDTLTVTFDGTLG